MMILFKAGSTHQALGWVDLVLLFMELRLEYVSMKTVFYKNTLQENFYWVYFKCYHEYCFSIVSGEQGM